MYITNLPYLSSFEQSQAKVNKRNPPIKIDYIQALFDDGHIQIQFALVVVVVPSIRTMHVILRDRALSSSFTISFLLWWMLLLVLSSLSFFVHLVLPLD